MKRRWIWIGGIVLAAGLIALAARFFASPRLHGEAVRPAKAVADFTLQSDHGPVRLSDFRGRLVVFFFAYTYCPDVAPTAMSTIKGAMNRLGDDARQVQVILVSVDPQRDTPDRLGGYARNFRPDFIGITGTTAEIDQVTADFGVIYRINPPESASGDYTVDHSSSILLIDQDGKLAYSWPFTVSAEDLAADLQVLIRQP